MATTSKPKTAEKPNDDLYTGVDNNRVSSEHISAYTEYSTEKRVNDNGASPTKVRLACDSDSSFNQDNSPREKKGCCKCFGFKKKTKSQEKTETMDQGEKSSEVAAPDKTNFKDDGVQFSKISSNVSSKAQSKVQSKVKSKIQSTHQSSENTQYPLFQTPTVRRIRIPDRPNISLNLWTIMKNCIGKDITKMPLPVNFSEPLSMLQRLTEDYEYSDILNIASKIDNSYEQMVYVAAFTISSYATTTVRTNKPFNPLLGETFECDRSKDLGWKCINEKVVHHPPCIAQHCEGKSWTCWQQFSMTSKFHTNSLNVIPLGTSRLQFSGEEGNSYSWRKISTIVHNIMFGKLWVGQEGEMTIVNHVDGTNCVLKYFPPESGGNDAPKKVAGEVFNKKGELKWKVTGLWDSIVEACEVLQISPEKLGPKRKLWSRAYPPAESEKYYNFTELACQLNELEEGIAPTDSRLRPDQRFMENALWDEANNEKRRLEDKQRAARRKFSQDSKTNVDGVEPGYTPAWFKHITDPQTGISLHIYNGEYWSCKDKQDWSRCLDIYS